MIILYSHVSCGVSHTCIVTKTFIKHFINLTYRFVQYSYISS